MNKIPIGRRRILLCLEGWYYVLVLSFIAGAAILRRANLLLILAALLTAPLIFNWRFVCATLKKLVFSRKVPPFIEAGQLFDVEVQIENQRSNLDSWSIQLEENIASTNESQNERVLISIDKVPCSGSAAATYQCVLFERGVYEFGKVTASTSFPSGLVKAFSVVDLPQKVFVSPRLGKVSMQWKNWLAADEVDEPRSMGGKGNEDGAFHAIRDYRAGDSRRSIHWRSTAKLGKPAVKQFERQSDQEINLVLDLATAEAASPEGKFNAATDRTEFCLSFFASVVDQVCKSESCELNVLLLGNFIKQFRGAASRPVQAEIGRGLAEIDVTILDTGMSELKQFANSNGLVAPLFVVSTRAAVAKEQLPSIKRSGIVIQRFFILGETGQNQMVYWLNAADQNIESWFRMDALSEIESPPNRSTVSTLPIALEA